MAACLVILRYQHNPNTHEGQVLRAYLFVVLLLLLIFGSVAGYLYNKFSVLAGMDFTPPPITIAAATAQSAVWPPNWRLWAPFWRPEAWN